MSWKNLKLGAKLSVGFAIVLTLTVIVGIVGRSGMIGVKDRVAKKDGVSNMVQSILEAVNAQKDYVIKGTEFSVQNGNTAVKKVYDIGEKTNKMFDDQYNIDQVNGIINKTKQFSTAFDKYLKKEEEKNKLMAEMRSAANEVITQADEISLDQQAQLEDKLNAGAVGKGLLIVARQAIQALEIVESFKDVRINEKEVIISGESEFINKHQEGLEKTKKITDELLASFNLQRNIEQGARLKSALTKYENKYNKYIEKQDEQFKNLLLLNSSTAEAIRIADEALTDQEQKMESEITNANLMIIIFAVLALILGFFIALMISRAIAGPLLKSVEFANKVAEGNLNAQLDVNQKDEIGVLANALREMIASFKKGVDTAKRIAAGDLRKKTFNDNIKAGTLDEALYNMEIKLREIVLSINNVAAHVSNGSYEISRSSQTMAQGSSEQAASVEEVSASIEELTSGINQNADNAQRTRKIAENAAKGIDKGNKSVEITVDAMKNIAEKISVISEIAERTDMLAINAAIEAARAGEHGKGFAVVATEVRKLAEMTKVAAQKITDVASSSVDTAEESGALLKEIVPSIRETAELVQQIAQASTEQNSGIDQIVSAISQLNKVAQQNASFSEELSTGADELSNQSGMLKDVISHFKIDNSDLQSVKTQKKSFFHQTEENNPQTKDLNPGNKRGEDIDLSFDDMDDDFESM